MRGWTKAFRKSEKIAHRQLRLTIALALVFGFIYGGAQIFIDWRDQCDRVVSEVIDSVASVQRSAGEALWSLDDDLAGSIIEGLVGHRFITAARVETTSGLELARFDLKVEPHPYRTAIELLFEPIEEKSFAVTHRDGDTEVPVGNLIVTTDPQTAFDQLLRRSFVTMIGGIVKSILLAFGLYWLFLVTATRPLAELTRQIASIDPSDNTAPPIAMPAKHDQDELGQIADVVNGQVTRISKTIRQLEHAEKELSDANKSLEERVRVRTLELTREIEERASIEQKLRDAVVRADELANIRAQFLANMSHELRTPLNAIIGFSGLIADPKIVNDQQSIYQYGSHIKNAGKDLLALVNDILDLSRVDSGHLEVEFSEVDAVTLIDEVGVLLAPLIAENGNTWQVDVLQDCPQISTDRTHLKQVLVNLVANAAKFTNNGSVQVILDRAPEGPSAISFKVKDTGAGIGPEQLPTIFNRFDRGNVHITSDAAGSGLGLMIVQSLCDTMGWTISVSSELEIGSCFELVVPELPGLDTKAASA